MLKDLDLSSNEDKLNIDNLLEELLLEVQSNLMVAKEIKNNYIYKSKSIKFDK